MSSLRLIYIKRIAYTVAGLSSIQVYTENEEIGRASCRERV